MQAEAPRERVQQEEQGLDAWRREHLDEDQLQQTVRVVRVQEGGAQQPQRQPQPLLPQLLQLRQQKQLRSLGVSGLLQQVLLPLLPQQLPQRYHQLPALHPLEQPEVEEV